MATRRVLSTSITLILLYAPPTLAQPALDRVVGLTEYQIPLIITTIDGQNVGMLAKAAGVPLGFEGLQPRPTRLSIPATKRPLRDVLDAMVAADPRYEWRELDGVVVVRPVEAWTDPASALNNSVARVKLDDVVASDLYPVISRLLGVTAPQVALGDSHRFSLETPAETSLLYALNAMARAHGSLSWAITPTPTREAALPTILSLFVGSTGGGFGIPASAMTCCAAQSPSALGATVTAGGDVPVETTVVIARRLPLEATSPLERVVGTRADGRPLVVHSIGSSIKELAAVVRQPMGIEWLPPEERPGFLPAGSEGVTLTGMTLQSALTTLVTLDPRFEWRNLDGVIVLRPVTAWRDPASPLYHTVNELRLEDTTVAKAIGAFTTRVGSPEHARNSFPDTRTFTVDVPQGTVLDLLNGIARAHGELYWVWEPLAAPDRAFFSGRRFMVQFGVSRRRRTRLRHSLRAPDGSQIAINTLCSAMPEVPSPR